MLLDLPPELLDAILDASLPSGIEGLALTCKAIYRRAAPQLRRHNAYKYRWRLATRDSWVPGSILWILDHISRDPLIAKYIESLSFQKLPSAFLGEDEEEGADTETLQPGNDEDVKAAARDILLNPKAKTRIERMIAVSDPFLDSEEDAGLWCDEIWDETADALNNLPGPRRNPHYSLIALLGLLPNLKVLRLFEEWGELADRPGGVDICQFSSGVACLIQPQGYVGALSNLKVMLPFNEAGYNERQPLQSIQPFMTLPSLTEMYMVSMVGVDDDFTGTPFNWPIPTLSSSLVRIELWSCCLDADGLSALASHTPHLQIFKYSHEHKWPGCQSEWSPGAFIQALAQYCGNTIIELAVTIDFQTWISNGASSFLAFPKLQKLECDVEVFCGPPVESGQRGGTEPFVPDGSVAWTNDDIPCIGSMLPKSIVEVQLNADWPAYEKALISLLKNLKVQRQERLPKLERVIIRQLNGDGAKVVVEGAGATLEKWSNGPRSGMPEWKRRFFERVTHLESEIW